VRERRGGGVDEFMYETIDLYRRKSAGVYLVFQSCLFFPYKLVFSIICFLSACGRCSMAMNMDSVYLFTLIGERLVFRCLIT